MIKKISKIKSIVSRNNKFTIVLISISLLVLLAPVEKVEVGQQGVLYNTLMGKIDSKLNTGWHVVIPFIQRLTTYPINERIYKIYRDNNNWSKGIDASISSTSNDNQKVSIDATFIYILDKDKINYIYEKFNGQEIEQIEKYYLNDVFKAAVIDVVTKFSAYDVYSAKRIQIQEEVFDRLAIKFADTGVVIKDIHIDTVRLSPETEAVIKAQTIAEATRIEAKGKSDANKLISDSLTNKIMTYEAIQKMSESLKVMIVPGDVENQLDFTKLFEKLLDETEVMQSEVE